LHADLALEHLADVFSYFLLDRLDDDFDFFVFGSFFMAGGDDGQLGKPHELEHQGAVDVDVLDLAVRDGVLGAMQYAGLHAQVEFLECISQILVFQSGDDYADDQDQKRYYEQNNYYGRADARDRRGHCRSSIAAGRETAVDQTDDDAFQ